MLVMHRKKTLQTIIANCGLQYIIFQLQFTIVHRVKHKSKCFGEMFLVLELLVEDCLRLLLQLITVYFYLA